MSSGKLVRLTEGQEAAMEDLRREYGVKRWGLTSTRLLFVTDGDGDRWHVSPSGERRCLGGGLIASEVED